MGHLPELIQDLALILIVGAVVSLLFRKIRQPLVLGYIIAGFFVGPHLSLFPTVHELDNIKTLADIGVIFLLFSLGLEFSFKKLMKVGGGATITAFVEIIFITLTGYITGKLLGWSTIDSLFLGGMLASSSTTIIIRAFDELGVKARQYAKMVFGVLIVEDLVVILLMVLLPMISVSKEVEGSQLLLVLLKLLFFLSVWYMGGIFLIPSILKTAKKLLDDETLLIIALGLCLGMVVIGTKVGFSAELGAFIMGSILAETTLVEKVEHLIKPVKDLFATIFFVSIGMLIDPVLITEHWVAVLAVTLLVIFGKFISTTTGALLSGQGLKQSVQVGMSMAQIGEFAFIVATLGLSLGVISDYLFPVAVGASAITTFSTPYMIKYSGRFYDVLARIIPVRWLGTIENYSSSSQTIQSEGRWKKVVRSYATIVATNGIIVIAIILITTNMLLPLLVRSIDSETVAKIVTIFLTLAIAFPFLWALMVKRPESMAYSELWTNSRYNHGPLVMMEILRVIIGLLLIGFLVEKIFFTLISLVVVLPLMVLVFLIFSKRIRDTYIQIEMRFLSNLNARERAAARAGNQTGKPFQSREKPPVRLDLWEANIQEFEVHPDACFSGESLQNLSWRTQFGITVLFIKRGNTLIFGTNSSITLYPYDIIGVVGTEEQLEKFSAMFRLACESPDPGRRQEEIIINKILVSDLNNLEGKSIKESGINDRTSGLVIGVERGEERILNPASSTVFHKGDIVWLAGERGKLKKLE